MPYELAFGEDGNQYLEIGLLPDDESIKAYDVLQIQVKDWLDWYCNWLNKRGVFEMELDEVIRVCADAMNILGYDDATIPQDLVYWVTKYFGA